MSTHTHIYIYTDLLSIYPSIYPSIYLSTYPSINLSICPSVDLSIYCIFVYGWLNLTLEFSAHRLNQMAFLSPFMLKEIEKQISGSRWCVKSNFGWQVAMIFSRSFAMAIVNGVRTGCTEPCVEFCSRQATIDRHTRYNCAFSTQEDIREDTYFFQDTPRPLHF